MATQTLKLKMLEDRVLVKPMPQEDKTESGIYLPDSAKERPQKGEVMEVGPGKLLDNGQRVTPSVKKGDKILFGKYAGTEVKFKGEEYIILRESEILAIIESE
ncbi:MAG: co-chaperone GroES [bacterium]|jgi:chaperonin GroES